MDIYSGYWGIDENTPERFMRNARIAGVAERADARVGDMRKLPFADGEFDAVVSSYAIDHLRRDERPNAIAEVARVLKPGGEFLLMIIHVDWKTWLVSPLLLTTRRRPLSRGARCFSRTASLSKRKEHRSRRCIFSRRRALRHQRAPAR